MSNNIVRLPEVKKKYYNTSANKFKLFKSKTKVEQPPVLKLSDINLVPVSNQNKIISDFKAYNSYIKNEVKEERKRVHLSQDDKVTKNWFGFHLTVKKKERKGDPEFLEKLRISAKYMFSSASQKIVLKPENEEQTIKHHKEMNIITESPKKTIQVNTTRNDFFSLTNRQSNTNQSFSPKKTIDNRFRNEIKPHLNLTIKRKGYSFSPKKKLLRTNTMSISNNQCSIDNTNYLDVISPEEQHFMKVASSKHNNKVI